ncbi:MAG: thiamine pyrophosphate-dependent enzyme [Planctomycetota bacterium]|jgi:pyruvate/2-oxoacid:ferredoxin oxidoreductase beta subunit/NAD-dependent dihydropyrimidine dehydrogenase PreA subunit
MTIHTRGERLLERESPKELLDLDAFNSTIVDAYNKGTAEDQLPADAGVARSLIPPGTGILRDFSYIAPDIPEYVAENCVGCMECVTECPDTAILGKVVTPDTLAEHLQDRNEKDVALLRRDWAETQKYYTTYEKKGGPGGLFGIYIDPTKCKGCAECVTACGSHEALKMIPKRKGTLQTYQQKIDFYRELPETPTEFINERLLTDLMLAERSMLYVGGAGSCMGCGEGTALRMMLAGTGFVHGPENIGIVASTGCNTVYGSTYPYNPYLVPWTNSLFENGPADAMGVRMRWNQKGWEDKKLWVIGGDGAMLDIGFQSLSRMLTSGMDIKVLVLDTQVYSNTGGQASTSTFTGQNTKFSVHGKKLKGKTERRKELGQLCMMHPDVYVAQTTCAHINHFYRAILDANEFAGPAVINVYTTCQPEHGVADDVAGVQARLAVDTRAFPLFIHDPRKGDTMKERLTLRGNPSMKDDWYTDPKTKQEVTFVDFARSEGRFAKHFDKDGNPSELMLAAKEDRLKNWHQLQELAGLR